MAQKSRAWLRLRPWLFFAPLSLGAVGCLATINAAAAAQVPERATMIFPGHMRVTYEYFNAHASELTNANKELEDAIRTSVNSTVALLEVKDADEVVNGELKYSRNGIPQTKSSYSGSGMIFGDACYVVTMQHEVNRKLPLPVGWEGKVPSASDVNVSPIGYRTTIRRKDAYTGVIEEIAGTVIDALGDPSMIQKDTVLIRMDRPFSAKNIATMGQLSPSDIEQGSAFVTGYPGDLQTGFNPSTVVIDLGCSVKAQTSVEGKIDTNCISATGGSGGPVSALVRHPKKGMGFHVIALESGGNGGNAVAVVTDYGFKVPRSELIGSAIGNFVNRFGATVMKEIAKRPAGSTACFQ